MLGSACGLSACAHPFGERVEDLRCVFEVNACVGDALAVGGVFAFVALAAGHEVAFDHHPHDGLGAFGQLVGDGLGNDGLSCVVFVAVSVATVDHHALGCSTGFELCGGLVDAFGVVVGASRRAAQNQVACFVAGGFDNRGGAELGDGEEVVGVACGADGVDGDLNASTGSVFEADRDAQSGGQFAVDLAFGGPCADGSPDDEVGEVLRRDGVEELCAAWDAAICEFEQQAACNAQTFVNIERVVEVGVVDQPFPADGRARFFKVDPHDDQQVFFVLLHFDFESFRVLDGCVDIVNGAGSCHHQEAVIATKENIRGLLTAACHKLRGFGRDGLFL